MIELEEEYVEKDIYGVFAEKLSLWGVWQSVKVSVSDGFLEYTRGKKKKLLPLANASVKKLFLHEQEQYNMIVILTNKRDFIFKVKNHATAINLRRIMARYTKKREYTIEEAEMLAKFKPLKYMGRGCF